MSSRRPLLETVWDRNPRKLIVMVVEASGLAAMDTKKGYSDPYVKLSLGKQLYKTTVKRKILNPCYNELFFFEPDGNRLVLEVYDNIKQKFMGQAVVNDPALLEPEMIVEEYIDLKVRPGKKNDRAQGRLKVRMYYSTSPETRPSTSVEQHFYYDEYTPHFQTGDLVAYCEYGLLGACQKVATNNKVSRVGVLLRLANKWTQKEELYVLEVSRNIDGFLDAYRETATNGLSIFRFFERLHQVHAHAVYWVPLRRLLDERAKAKMVEHIWTLHAQITCENLHQMAQPGHAAVMDFLAARFGIGGKFAFDTSETFTPSIVAQCLSQAGLALDPRQGELTVADIVKHAAYQDPILLRCLQTNALAAPPPQQAPQPAPLLMPHHLQHHPAAGQPPQGPMMMQHPAMMMQPPMVMGPGPHQAAMPHHMLSAGHDQMMMMMMPPPQP